VVTLETRELHWSYLGRVAYATTERWQVEARETVRRGGAESLLLLEHPHVVTLGRNATEADVLAGASGLAKRGIELAVCDRGGQVTYHGPGQLVGYPILNLSPDRRDVRRYVRDLEEALVATLADCGVGGRPHAGDEPVGVWVGTRKIASLGIHLSRWITTHGFALNVVTDLSYFRAIVPCGLHEVDMTSIERETGVRWDLAAVAALAADHLARRFGRRLVAAAAPFAAAAAAVAAPGDRV
jgi:lipoyl(octanoyl) transferase